MKKKTEKGKYFEGTFSIGKNILFFKEQIEFETDVDCDLTAFTCWGLTVMWNESRFKNLWQAIKIKQRKEKNIYNSSIILCYLQIGQQNFK